MGTATWAETSSETNQNVCGSTIIFLEMHYFQTFYHKGFAVGTATWAETSGETNQNVCGSTHVSTKDELRYFMDT